MFGEGELCWNSMLFVPTLPFLAQLSHFGGLKFLDYTFLTEIGTSWGSIALVRMICRQVTACIDIPGMPISLPEHVTNIQTLNPPLWYQHIAKQDST